MARRTFDVIDVTEILVHWYAGRSQSELATSLGVDRKTMRSTWPRRSRPGSCPGGPRDGRGGLGATLVREWFPELVDTRLRQVTWPAIEAHRDYIAEQLKAGVTKATIHQRLRDEHGLDGVAGASLKRWVAANLAEEARAGAGHGAARRPPRRGRRRRSTTASWAAGSTRRPGGGARVWAFVMVLAVLAAHVRAPGADDGSARVDARRMWRRSRSSAGSRPGWCPDNLKTGVDKPDLYDPKINRSYAELAAHYGVLVDPARASKPKDKPRVERPMPYCPGLVLAGPGVRLAGSRCRPRRCAGAARSPGRGRAARWTARHPAAVFAAVEAAALAPLPRDAVRARARGRRGKVGPDIHVKVGKALYSVPWRLIGPPVDARDDRRRWCRSSHDGELIATHVARRARASTPTSSTTRRRRSPSTMRTPTWCRSQRRRDRPGRARR